MTCNNIAKRQRGGSTSSRTQFRGGKNLVFDVLSIFQTQRLRKIHEILVIFMHFSQRISGSFSAPREVLISSLVPLESSFQKLSNGTRLDVGSSRGAECERERVRWNHSFWWLIFWFLKNKRLVLSATRSSDLELGTVGKLFLQAFQRHQARCWKFPLCRMRAGTSSLKAQFWWWIFNFFFFAFAGMLPWNKHKLVLR